MSTVPNLTPEEWEGLKEGRVDMNKCGQQENLGPGCPGAGFCPSWTLKTEVWVREFVSVKQSLLPAGVQSSCPFKDIALGPEISAGQRPVCGKTQRPHGPSNTWRASPQETYELTCSISPVNVSFYLCGLCASHCAHSGFSFTFYENSRFYIFHFSD